MRVGRRRRRLRERFCKLVISPDLFLSWFTAGDHGFSYRVTENAIPEDAKLVNVRHAWPNAVELLIESQSYDELKEGDEIPTLAPVRWSRDCEFPSAIRSRGDVTRSSISADTVAMAGSISAWLMTSPVSRSIFPSRSRC